MSILARIPKENEALKKLMINFHFSAKVNIIEEEYAEHSNEVLEEMHLIALLTKGGQSLSRVENRMKILAHYINSANVTISSRINLIEE